MDNRFIKKSEKIQKKFEPGPRISNLSTILSLSENWDTQIIKLKLIYTGIKK